MNITMLKKWALAVFAAGATLGVASPAAAQDVNHVDRDGESLLMKAAERGWVDEVQRLLTAGAQVNAKDKDCC